MTKGGNFKAPFKAGVQKVIYLSGEVAAAWIFLSACANTQAQNLYASSLDGKIYKFTPGGGQTVFASGVGAAGGLAFDSAGNLFVADYSTGRISRIAPNGVTSTFAQLSGGAVGLTIDASGNLFVGNMVNGTITEISPGGVSRLFASGLNEPTALAFNSSGVLFEADAGSGNVNEFTTTGLISTFASGLNHPYGLAFDRTGNLLVASEPAPNDLFKITPQGYVSTFYSGYSAHPLGLAIDSNGNLFAADSTSGGIDEFTAEGVESIFAAKPVNGQFEYLAFQPAPEPSTLGLLVMAAVTFHFGRSYVSNRARGNNARIVQAIS